jgi:hypothetical protein
VCALFLLFSALALLLYPGLLVTAALLDVFNRDYYCPTALRLPSLDYVDDAGKKIKMFLIGDPVEPGPIINDGGRSGRQSAYTTKGAAAAGTVTGDQEERWLINSSLCVLFTVSDNCILQSVKDEHLPRVLTRVSSSQDKVKYRVSTEVAAVYAQPNQTLQPSQELLLSYGGDLFWKLLQQSPEYCIACFSRRDVNKNNPLVLCEGVDAQGRKCAVSRHRSCFPEGMRPSLADLESQSAIQFFCPDHLSCRVSQRSSSRAQSRVPQTPAPHSLEPVFTPPSRAVLAAAAAAAAVATAAAMPDLRPVFTPPSRVAASTLSAPSSLTPRSLVSALNDSDSRAPYDSESHPFYTSPSSVSNSEFHAIDFDASADDEEPLSPADDSYDDPDEDGEKAPCASSFGRRSFAPARPVLHAEHLDAPQSKKPPLKVRKTPNMLPSFALLHLPLNEAQKAKVAQLLTWNGKGKRPWYTQKTRFAPRAGVPSRAASVASAAASVAASEGAVPMEIDDNASLRTNATQGKGKATVNRWFEPAPLAFDWAEYKSCCGDDSKVDAFLMRLPSDTRRSHSSKSMLAMFEARVKHRALFDSQVIYNYNVSNALKLVTDDRVPWLGSDICVSCYRAVLGISRSSLFHLRNWLDPLEREGLEGLTHGMRMRQARARTQMDRAIKLIQSYAKCGDHVPNPKSANADKQHVVMPQTRMCDFRGALEEHERDRKRQAVTVPLSRSSLQRGLKELKKNDFTVSVAKSKDLCRCNDCETLDNLLKPEVCKTRDPYENALTRLQKESHLKTMLHQRKHVDTQKELALEDPTEVHCILLDGMDQAKTCVPCKPRFSKEQEAQQRLKVHVVGAYCFGGSVPVMALCNFPDLRKDSSLAVTTLDAIIDAQWKKNEELEAAAREAEADNAPLVHQVLLDPPAAAAAAPAGAAAAKPRSARFYRGVGDRWPRRLHVTFDNATSECKNQWMFRYLGALVLHGVYDCITVSTLLVGHTHDIVDQMFGVWAKALKISGAETFEKMRELFHDKYHARIRGLISIMRGNVEAAAAAGLQLSPEELEVIQEARAIDEAGEWSPEAADRLSAVADAMCPDKKVCPEVILQTFSVDVQAWLQRANNASADHDLNYVGNPHMFGIERDKHNGNIYLYNSFLVNSTGHSTQGEIHSYPNQQTGSYSTRALLYRHDERISIDPSRLTPLVVETASLRQTVATFQQQNAMTAEDATNFTRQLRSFDETQENLAKKCEACATWVGKIADIGTISQRKGATEAEKGIASAKTKERRKCGESMALHLKDPAFAKEHKHLELKDHWLKWLRRAEEHIHPSYISRTIWRDPQLLDLHYHLHPANLVSNGDEPLLFAKHGRVDVSWLQNHGPPVINDWVIARTDKSREPFWVGRVTGIAAEEERKESEAGSAAAPPQFGRHHFLEQRARAGDRPQLSDLPALQVEWWDLLAADCTRLKLTDDEHWAAQFTAHGTTEEKEVAASAAAAAEDGSGHTGLAWVVDQFKNVKFARVGRGDRQVKEVKATALIVWGGANEKGVQLLLKADGAIRDPIWKRLRLDLTGEPAPAAASAAASGAAAAPAAAAAASRGGQASAARGKRKASGEPQAAASAHRAAKRRHTESDSEEEYQPAAPAASARRSTRARTNANYADQGEGEEEEEESD